MFYLCIYLVIMNFDTCILIVKHCMYFDVPYFTKSWSILNHFDINSSLTCHLYVLIYYSSLLRYNLIDVCFKVLFRNKDNKSYKEIEIYISMPEMYIKGTSIINIIHFMSIVLNATKGCIDISIFRFKSTHTETIDWTENMCQIWSCLFLNEINFPFIKTAKQYFTSSF